MAQALRRKLTTILSADVADYSRLMDGDEVATVETLKAYRGAISGFVERHRGRVVSTSGDGLLADFDSVVEAVQCAAEIQRELNSPLALGCVLAFSALRTFGEERAGRGVRPVPFRSGHERARWTVRLLGTALVLDVIAVPFDLFTYDFFDRIIRVK